MNSLTLSEEKTAEERARTIDGAIQRIEDHLNGSGNFDLVEAMSVLEHEVKEEIISLRLTNQRLEAEVRRLKKEVVEWRDEVRDNLRGGMSTLDEDGVQQTL